MNTITNTLDSFQYWVRTVLAAKATEMLGQPVNTHFMKSTVNQYPCYRVSRAKVKGFDSASRENYHRLFLYAWISGDMDESAVWTLMDAFFEVTGFSSERVNQWIHLPIYRETPPPEDLETVPVPISKMRLLIPDNAGFSEKGIKNDDESILYIFDHLELKYRNK